MRYGIPKLNINKDLKILLFSVLILHIGLYLVIPILPVILSSEKKINTSEIGIILGAGSLAFQLGSVKGGVLADRIGKKITMIIGAVIMAISLLGYAMANKFAIFLIFSLIYGIGQGLYSPTLKAAIAAIASNSARTQTTAFSLRGIAANGGVCIAGLLIFALSGLKSSIIFFLTAGVFCVLSIITWILIPKDCSGEECPKVPANSYLMILKNRSFIIFSIISVFIFAFDAQLNLLLPLRANAVLTNGKLVGTIWTITGIAVILFQGIISKYLLHSIHTFTALFLGMLCLGGGIFVIGLSNNFFMLILSSVIFMFGEMFIMPTADFLTSHMSHSGLLGAYFGIANFITGIGSAIGNFAGGKIIDIYGINTNLKPWFIFGIASLIISIILLIAKRLPSISKYQKVS